MYSIAGNDTVKILTTATSDADPKRKDQYALKAFHRSPSRFLLCLKLELPNYVVELKPTTLEEDPSVLLDYSHLVYLGSCSQS